MRPSAATSSSSACRAIPSTDLRQAPDRPARRPHPDAARAGSTSTMRWCRAGRSARYDGDRCYVETLPMSAREHEIIEISDAEPARRHAGVRRAGRPLLHDGRQPRQLPRQPHRAGRRAASASCRRRTWSPAPTGCCCRATPSVGWLDVAEWPHAFRLARFFGRIEATERVTTPGASARRARSISSRCWRCASTVMREHLERVFRYEPVARAAHLPRAFRRTRPAADPDRRGCRGLRRLPRSAPRRSSSTPSISQQRYHNTGLGTAILKVLLAEADALGLPIRLEVLTGSKADRFYLRHGFVKLSEEPSKATTSAPFSFPSYPPASPSRSDVSHGWNGALSLPPGTRLGRLRVSLHQSRRSMNTACSPNRLASSGGMWIGRLLRFSTMARSTRTPMSRHSARKSSMLQRWMLGVSYHL